MSQSPNVEAIYPLAPLQEGILFHTLYAPQSGLYFEHLICPLEGNLNVLLFRRAWEKVIEMHPALRTLFVWEGREKPLQVVRKTVDLPWEEQEWYGFQESQQQERLQDFLNVDRSRGFALNEAPLMRFTLIRLAERKYQFIWSHHHLLMDGWSVFYVLGQVFELYRAFLRGAEPEMQPSRPFRDYINWLNAQDNTQAESFWRSALQGFTTPTTLSRVATAMLQENAGQSSDYLEYYCELSEQETAALQTLAREQHLTINTFLQGAWSLLISRYSAQNDVLFGVTVSGRPAGLHEVESIVGLFINTLPLRVQVSPEQKLLPWLQKIQAEFLDVRQFEHMSLVKIQECSAVPHGQQFFDSLLVFENYPLNKMDWLQGEDLTVNTISSMERSSYPLTLVVEPGKQLKLFFLYDKRRFSCKTLEIMAGHLLTILHSMVAQPNQNLSTIPWINEVERETLLVGWNNTDTQYPSDQALAVLFEEQVCKTPNAIAMIFDNQTTSYAELNARANQMAHYLSHKGVRAGDLVGLFVERSAEWLVGMLGIIKAGGAYVPLDPDYPAERLAFMLEDTRVGVLVTQSNLLHRLPDGVMQLICMDTDASTINTQPVENLTCQVTAENLAYVIYTSGSTGKPKGIAIPQRAINRLVRNTNYIQITADDRFGQASNASFDAATFEIWGAFLNGASLVEIPKEVALSPTAFAEHIRANKIGIMFLTVALFNQIMRELPNAFETMRLLMVGGDALDPKWVRIALEKGAPGCLMNGYGPTESTTFAAWYPIKSIPENAVSVPIGYPLANTQLYVLDANLQLTPVGLEGELYIGGDGLAHGYINRPDLTSERFVPNPFGRKPGERLYKTGDRARHLEDGAIEFIGRTDFQVKIRGFRIEINEIEAVLDEHPSVQDAILAVRKDEGDGQLIAYLLLKPGEKPDSDELRNWLKKKLPVYMVPSLFIFVEQWPLTPNGKVDRSALPAPETAQAAPRLSYVAPSTVVEEAIASLWAQVLKVERVGLYDNFFELGGHSLLATQLVSRLRDAFQIDLGLRDLFEHTTVSELVPVLFAKETIPGKTEKVAQVLKHLAGMTPAEVKKILEAERLRKGKG